ncbi:MAG: methylmalonyl Co-A mutase-associated GTPase MeaB [Nitrososphaeraceae archaeon]|nr:methylmalonyl Co-A mutase-associated GTPase MeaB [Nitrososphaeraceae archaeon]
MSSIVDKIVRGDRRILSKTISMIDNQEEGYKNIIKQIFKKTGKAFTIGFTGPGGAGKSSLIGKLVPEFQSLGYKVAILAVDPTSPISGGAILGDRVRMQNQIVDNSQVFMRSIASRGASGGISRSLRNIVRILDVAGYNLILVESVGAGQLEVEVSKIVNLTLVLFTPQTGDKVQAVKAGLTEIGDIYVINKCDIEGANSLFNTIRDLIGSTDRKPIVIKTSVKKNEGIKELSKTIHHIQTNRQNILKEKEIAMIDNEIKEILFDEIQKKFTAKLEKNKEYRILLEQIYNKNKDPFYVADKLSKLLIK